MTKSIRIENADTSDHKVLIEVWEKSAHEDEDDYLVETHNIDFPTAMEEIVIWEGRYIVVKETE